MAIELQIISSILLAVLIPVLIIAISFVIYYLSKLKSNSRIRRIARLLSEPFHFTPISKNPDLLELPETQTRKIISNEIILRASLVYYIIVVFLLCSFLGELYQVLADRTILLIFTQIIYGTAPPSFVWTSIVIESPFASPSFWKPCRSYKLFAGL